MSPKAVQQIVKQQSYDVVDQSVDSEANPEYLLKKDTIYQNLRDTFKSKVIHQYTSPNRKSTKK